MAGGTGGSPSATKLSFGATTPDCASAAIGTRRAGTSTKRDSLSIRGSEGGVGRQKATAPSAGSRGVRRGRSFRRIHQQGGGGDGGQGSRQPRILTETQPPPPAHPARGKVPPG